MKYKTMFSPVVNDRLERKITGKLHNWINLEEGYYSSAYICKNCGRRSWGWNLWREDFQPTCKPRPQKIRMRQATKNNYQSPKAAQA